MSTVEKSINLNPSKWGISTENYTVRGFVCPKCEGKGKITIYPAPWEELTGVVECERCSGSGLLYADVKIEWRKQERKEK